MRPSRPPRRGLRAALVALVGVAALLAATVAPVAASVNPGPSSVPALSGLVTNACTGLPVPGVTVGVSLIDSASGQPGPVQHPPSPNLPALFSYPTLDPGTYQLTVSAPGYVPLGGGTPGTVGGSQGVTLIVNPGPPGLPAGQSFASGLVLDIGLIRSYTSGPCHPPSPNFPAVSGRAVDAATGMGLTGLTVGLAPLVVDPATGMVGPGPTQMPSFGPFLGLFAFKSPGPSGYGFQFYASAPGYATLGMSNPGSAQGPGVTVMYNPGPIDLPAGTGSVNLSVVVAIALPAVQ